MHSVKHNHLHCRGGDDIGYVLPDHERHVGAPHMVCGTAGINESRIEWFDGFQDDFDAYVSKRSHITGKLLGYHQWKGELAGENLLTHDEYEQLKDVQDELKERAKNARAYAVEQRQKILEANETEGKSIETLMREHFAALVARMGDADLGDADLGDAD